MLILELELSQHCRMRPAQSWKVLAVCRGCVLRLPSSSPCQYSLTQLQPELRPAMLRMHGLYRPKLRPANDENLFDKSAGAWTFADAATHLAISTAASLQHVTTVTPSLLSVRVLFTVTVLSLSGTSPLAVDTCDAPCNTTSSSNCFKGSPSASLSLNLLSELLLAEEVILEPFASDLDL